MPSSNYAINATNKNRCPICGSDTWCYQHRDNLNLWRCKRSSIAPPGYRLTSRPADKDGGLLFVVDDGVARWSEEQKAEWAETQRQREANEAERRTELFRKKLTAEQRDPLLRELFGKFSLDTSHRQQLKNRGLNDEQIDRYGFVSIGGWDKPAEKKILNQLPKGFIGLRLSKKGDKYLHPSRGFVIPTRDPANRLTGWQFRPVPVPRDGAKYLWPSGEKIEGEPNTTTAHLPLGNAWGELPIQIAKESHKPSKTLWLVEGTLKPIVAACLHSIDVAGASSGNFAASATQVKQSINGYNRIVVAIDAGDAINPQRYRHWRLQADFLRTLDIELKWAWWGQDNKTANDLDEMVGYKGREEFKSIQLYDTEEFFEIVDKAVKRHEHLARYESLAKLTDKPTLVYNEPYVRDIQYKPGTITIISSGVGTGKTEALVRYKLRHEQKYPEAKFYMPSHRNQLAKSAGERMGIDHISQHKHGYENYTAINSQQGIAYCLDSYHHIDTRDIPSHSAMFFDEGEAVLKHQNGATLGDRAPETQKKWVEHTQGLLDNLGHLIVLEDDLSQITIDTLRYLFPRNNIEIIVNQYNRFNYPVKIGGHGSHSDFIGCILDRIKQGEKVAIPTNGQEFGHILERVIKHYNPDIKIARIDSRTNTQYDDFLAAPGAWLALNQIQVLIYSPTIESGVSIVDPDPDNPLFDSIWAYAVGSIRSQIQMLHRYRGNCPRYIFSPKSRPNNYAKDPSVIYKLDRQHAKARRLKHGLPSTNTELGEIYSQVNCKFKARDAISSAYNRSILIDELKGRGHEVEEVKWSNERLFNNPRREVISEHFKAFRLEIQLEDCDKLIAAITDGITLTKAIAIVCDPSIAFDDKWAAKKVLLADELPGYNLADRAYVHLALQPKITRKLDIRAFIANPDLCHAIEGLKLEKQAQQPHILYHRTPKDPALAELLRPIWGSIEELVKLPKGFDAETPAAIAIQQYAVKNSYQFYSLARLTIKEVTKDRNGVTKHSIPTTVNKILRLLAYETDDSQQTDGSRRYRITNANDPTHSAYIEARQRKATELSTKYQGLAKRRQLDIQSIDEPIEYGTFEVDDSEVGVDPPPIEIADSPNIIPITAMSQPTHHEPQQSTVRADDDYVQRWLEWESGEIERIKHLPYLENGQMVKLLAQENLTKARKVFREYCQLHHLNPLAG